MYKESTKHCRTNKSGLADVLMTFPVESKHAWGGYVLDTKYEVTKAGWGTRIYNKLFVIKHTFFFYYIPQSCSYAAGLSWVKWARLIYLPPLSSTILIPGHLTGWLQIMFRWLQNRWNTTARHRESSFSL